MPIQQTPVLAQDRRFSQRRKTCLLALAPTIFRRFSQRQDESLHSQEHSPAPTLEVSAGGPRENCEGKISICCSAPATSIPEPHSCPGAVCCAPAARDSSPRSSA